MVIQELRRPRGINFPPKPDFVAEGVFGEIDLDPIEARQAYALFELNERKNAFKYPGLLDILVHVYGNPRGDVVEKVKHNFRETRLKIHRILTRKNLRLSHNALDFVDWVTDQDLYRYLSKVDLALVLNRDITVPQLWEKARILKQRQEESEGGLQQLQKFQARVVDIGSQQVGVQVPQEPPKQAEIIKVLPESGIEGAPEKLKSNFNAYRPDEIGIVSVKPKPEVADSIFTPSDPIESLAIKECNLILQQHEVYRLALVLINLGDEVILPKTQSETRLFIIYHRVLSTLIINTGDGYINLKKVLVALVEPDINSLQSKALDGDEDFLLSLVREKVLPKLARFPKEEKQRRLLSLFLDLDFETSL